MKPLFTRLFGSICVICGTGFFPLTKSAGKNEGSTVLCPGCYRGLLEDQLSFVEKSCCTRCGRPVPVLAGDYCIFCRQDEDPVPLGNRGVFFYQAYAARCIHSFKFKRCKAMADIFLPFLSELLNEIRTALDISPLLVPVPSNPARRREYDQAVVLARRLGFVSGLQVADRLLKRKRGSRSQKLLGREERKENLQGYIFCASGASKASAPVILVDDVFTTGSTIHTCHNALIESGYTVAGSLCLALD